MSAGSTEAGGAAQAPTETVAPDVKAAPKVDANATAAAIAAATASKTEAPAVVEYTDFTMPEGQKMDDSVLGEFRGLAKDMGLTQENAQKLVDLGFKLAGSNTEALQGSQQETWTKQRETWVNELKNDKEFGGENFNANIEQAKLALRRFGDDSIRGFLESTGFGDHAGLVKMFAKIARETGEMATVDGVPRAGADSRSFADVMYGSGSK